MEEQINCDTHREDKRKKNTDQNGRGRGELKTWGPDRVKETGFGRCGRVYQARCPLILFNWTDKKSHLPDKLLLPYLSSDLNHSFLLPLTSPLSEISLHLKWVFLIYLFFFRWLLLSYFRHAAVATLTVGYTERPCTHRAVLGFGELAKPAFSVAFSVELLIKHLDSHGSLSRSERGCWKMTDLDRLNIPAVVTQRGDCRAIAVQLPLKYSLFSVSRCHRLQEVQMVTREWFNMASIFKNADF